MKSCSRCRKLKSASDFARNASEPDGLQRACRSCRTEIQRESRRRRADGARVRARRYHARNATQARTRAANYKVANPEVALAHKLVSRAIVAGELQRASECSLCGSSAFAIQAHHEDYSKPLAVRWLCAPCHKSLHIRQAEAKP